MEHNNELNTNGCNMQIIPSSVKCTITTNEEQLVCDFCSIIFQSKSQFLRHRRIHTEDDPFVCVHCGEAFTQHQDLRKHRDDIHSQNKAFKCPCCSKAFATQSELNAHQWRHTGKKQHICHICGKAYSTKGNLKHHINKHTGMVLQECFLCAQKFNSHSALEGHMSKHTGVKRYKCHHCDKCYATSSQLTLHKRIHTGEKPYACSVCQKTFRLRSTQVNHERCHSNSRPYKCHICQRAFTQIINLRQHIKTHESRQSRCLVCPICLKEVFSGRTMQKHLSRHNEIRLANRIADVHENEPIREDVDDNSNTKYKCFACDLQLVSMNALARHVERKHCQKLSTYNNNKRLGIETNGSQPCLCICSICTQTYTDYNSLRNHIQNSHPSEAWRMGLVEMDSNRCMIPIEETVDEVTINDTNDKFRCWFCPKIFTSPSLAVQHMTQEHDNLDSLSSTIAAVNKLDEKRTLPKNISSNIYNQVCCYTCTQCNEILNGREAYEIHLLKHQVDAIPIKPLLSVNNRPTVNKYIPILPKPYVTYTTRYTPLLPTITYQNNKSIDFLVELDKICQSLQVNHTTVTSKNVLPILEHKTIKNKQQLGIKSRKSCQITSNNINKVAKKDTIHSLETKISTLSSPFLSALQDLSSNIHQIVHTEGLMSNMHLKC